MVDNPLLAAVHGVAQDLRDMRADLTGRMDAMVTRREHDAEVRRLDAEAQSTRDLLLAHEQSADRRLDAQRAEQRAADEQIREQIAEGERRREEAQIAAAERRKADRRWTATWTLGAAAFMVTASTAARAWLG
ncbi:hypothetical protein [Cellulomonas composti]|uniref:Uncharacterized protein n=1 Tax=Cellulomonas composti TaxID=266130 RepID=A0A511JC61_9CELL|nr:hypothetical protein [Cellulomonas composti]GEL95349.1 hypothetical protein CCO02nite_20070 [Cellulomonas composti]